MKCRRLQHLFIRNATNIFSSISTLIANNRLVLISISNYITIRSIFFSEQGLKHHHSSSSILNSEYLLLSSCTLSSTLSIRDVCGSGKLSSTCNAMKTFITIIPLLFLELASAYTTPQPSCVSSRKAFLKTCAVVAPSTAFYVATAQPAAAFDGSGSNAYSGKGVTSKSDLKKSYSRRVIADIKVSICSYDFSHQDIYCLNH